MNSNAGTLYKVLMQKMY